MQIVEMLFASLRPKVDAPTEVLDKLPNLAPAELFEAFQRAHGILDELHRAILSGIGGDDRGQPA